MRNQGKCFKPSCTAHSISRLEIYMRFDSVFRIPYFGSIAPHSAVLIPVFPLPQIWLLLPGFCSSPVDVCLSFKPVSRLLGSALSEGAELRAVICHALRVLIETTRNSGERSAVENGDFR